MVHICPLIGVKVPLFINLSVHQEIELYLNASSFVNKPYLSLLSNMEYGICNSME